MFLFRDHQAGRVADHHAFQRMGRTDNRASGSRVDGKFFANVLLGLFGGTDEDVVAINKIKRVDIFCRQHDVDLIRDRS